MLYLKGTAKGWGYHVTCSFKGEQLKNTRPGEPVTIHVDAYGRDYRGHVLNITGAMGERFGLLPPDNANGNHVKVSQRIPVKTVSTTATTPE